jgi:uncharacterized protein
MKIKIDDIPEEGLSLDIEEDWKAIEKLAGKVDFSIPSPVKAHLDITRSGAMVGVSGEVKADVAASCSRCLKDFTFTVDACFERQLLREGAEEREKELKIEDMEITHFKGDSLDTSEIVLEEIALQIPIKLLCNADCRGLCPRCGVDLNAGPCACPAEEKADKRFEKLKDFKIKSKGKARG